MTMPAAWVEALRYSPSSSSAVSSRVLTAGSASRASFRRGSRSMAWARVTGLAGLFGTILQSRSTCPSGICSTRPTSRSTARACRVPKVMIWATRSLP
ncbi:hypothetical protein D3C81_1239930 [compost metagenome]